MCSIHDPRYQYLIKKLIELRESKDVTQVELARHLNKPQSYVSKIEILEKSIDVIEVVANFESRANKLYKSLKYSLLFILCFTKVLCILCI